MQKYTPYILVAFLVATFAFVVPGLLGAPPDRVTLCHTPPDPDVTMEVPTNSVDAHLSHNDYLGTCTDSSSSSSSETSSSSSSSSSSEESSSSSSSSSSEESSSSSSSSSSEENSSSSSSSSSEESSSSSASSSGNGGGNSSSLNENNTTTASETPLLSNDGGGGGGGGASDEDNPDILDAIFSGHGLAEHISAVDFILSTNNLQQTSLYSIGGQGRDPQNFLDSRLFEKSKSELEHAAFCSMFRYFQRLATLRPYSPDYYIEWISLKLAEALGKKEEEVKAVIVGRPPMAPYEDAFLASISSQGCAANAFVFTPETEKDVHDVHDVHTDQSNPLHSASPLDNLQILDKSTDTDLSFSVMQGNEVFKDYRNSLTHEMHMIIIRNDLQYFHHIHPERDHLGTWHIPFAPAVGGTYWLYTNFIDSEGHSYGLRFIRQYPGSAGGTGEILDFSMEKTIDSYRFRLIPDVVESGMSFTYVITDEEGKLVYPQRHMGAFGHQVIISKTAYFSHSHPVKRANQNPVFYVEAPPEGTYVIVAAFQIRGKDYTLSYRWKR